MTAPATRSGLSGGNQQRVNIAIGLMAGPSVLLLDEPSVGLDPAQRERLWGFVLGLVGEAPPSPSTHDIQEAERYAERIVVVAEGEGILQRHRRRAPPGGGGRGRTGRRPRNVLPSPTSGGAVTDALAALRTQILKRSPLQLTPADPLSDSDRPAGRLRGMTRDQDQTKVALYNAMPAGELPRLRRGGGRRQRDPRPTLGRVDCVEADSTADAKKMVESARPPPR